MSDETILKAPDFKLQQVAAEMAETIRQRFSVSREASKILDVICLRMTHQVARTLEMQGLLAGRELYAAMNMSPPTAVRHARDLTKKGQAWQSPRRMNKGTVLVPKALAVAIGEARAAKKQQKIDIAKLRAAVPPSAWRTGIGRKRGGWHPSAKE